MAERTLTQTKEKQLVQLIVFTLGDEEFCVAIGDIREILTNPGRADERRDFAERLKHRKPGLLYAERSRFDSVQNVTHSFVEAYPILGIMGTILAISAGFQQPSDGGPAVSQIVESFQIAFNIKSTF